MQKKCHNCGNEFEALRNSTKYCSPTCYHEAVREQMSTFTRRKNIEDRIELTITSAKPVTIVFLADVHNNYDYLSWAINKIKENPHWLVVINGDLFDADQFSTHPTRTVVSLESAVDEVTKMLKPIFKQIIGFVWGNHEERCFRRGTGKGTMPSYFNVLFNAWKTVQSDAVIIEPMKALILRIRTNDKDWRCLVKHGKSAGKNFGVMEFREVLATNEDIDAFVLSHVHIPEHKIVQRPTIEDPREIHLIRTTAGVAFLPYQDKANLFICPLGLTRVRFGNQIKVTLK